VVNYEVNHIPSDKYKRSGIKMIPEYITIHSTGNPRSTAQNERDWLTSLSNKRQTSWHIVVDERQAIEAVPLDEVAWHAGDGRGDGNMKSIGIEICESGNREKTLQNAVKLVIKLLKERGWGVNRLKRHYDWSGKCCPRIMSANNWAGWGEFKLAVQKELETKKVKVNIGGKICELNGFLKDGVNYIAIREAANLFGYDVGWESGCVVIKNRANDEVIKSLDIIQRELDSVKIKIGGM